MFPQYNIFLTFQALLGKLQQHLTFSTSRNHSRPPTPAQTPSFLKLSDHPLPIPHARAVSHTHVFFLSIFILAKAILEYRRDPICVSIISSQDGAEVVDILGTLRYVFHPVGNPNIQYSITFVSSSHHHHTCGKPSSSLRWVFELLAPLPITHPPPLWMRQIYAPPRSGRPSHSPSILSL